MQHSWRLQDAKARFSALVDAAVEGNPQHVTRRGKPAVVVVSAEEYRRLQRGARAAAPGFIDHLLAIPRSGPGSAKDEASLTGPRLRDVDFG